MDLENGPFIQPDHVNQNEKLYRAIQDWQTRTLELAAAQPGQPLQARLLTVD